MKDGAEQSPNNGAGKDRSRNEQKLMCPVFARMGALLLQAAQAALQ